MSPASASRAYAREFSIAMAAYVVAVLITVKLTPSIDPAFRALFVLIPLIPSAFVLRAYLRFLGRMDELGRRIQLEALAIGFAAAGMLTFAYGFLENAGFPQLSYVFVFPLMIFLWGIGSVIATRRYQ
jgi:O-antigen/teichoic acid export membrane protein